MKRLLFIIAVLVAAGVFVVHMSDSYFVTCKEKFSLLNPRRQCEKDNPVVKREYDILMNDILKQISDWKAAGDVSHVTVYFRDLENGPIFDIDSKERFAPASLLKVPIMLALLKYSEQHPEILDKTVSVDAIDPALRNVTDPEKTIVAGQAYPVRQVLRKMIVFSDNASKEILYELMEQISPDFVQQTFIDLGVALQNADGSSYVTIKTYASLFRSLYNASFLNREMSELALSMLADVEFDEGFTAGLPKNIKVAHKFGYLDLPSGEKQLHECGIIYFPRTPYVLCVMTRGQDEKKIASVIATISKDVFTEVSSRD